MNTRNMRIPSNKVRDIERYCFLELATLYDEREIRQMVYMLFEAYLGWDMAQFLMHRNGTINQSDLLKFHWAVEYLKQHKPIQQIIGYTDFADCRINVNEDVLIPRPETEEIVNHLCKENLDNSQILDVCTGSGCIAIALAKHFPTATVHAIELSEKALTTAQSNAKNNNVAVTFHQMDILNPEFQQWNNATKFNLIVSNPPYVKESEKAAMQPNVLDYEPEMALFVSDNDPLVFYQAIAKFALNHLAPHGQLVFEINETLGKETCEMLSQLGFTPALHKDFRDRDRMVIATL